MLDRFPQARFSARAPIRNRHTSNNPYRTFDRVDAGTLDPGAVLPQELLTQCDLARLIDAEKPSTFSNARTTMARSISLITSDSP